MRAGKKRTLGSLLAMRNQMRLLEKMRIIRDTADNAGIYSFYLDDGMTKMEDWSRSRRQAFNPQEVTDAEMEMERLKDWVTLLGFLPQKGHVYTGGLGDELKRAIQLMKDSVRYTESQQGSIKELLKRMEKSFPSKDPLALYASKRRPVKRHPTTVAPRLVFDRKQTLTLEVKHVGWGHWFKCRAGHIYNSKDSRTHACCPECK